MEKEVKLKRSYILIKIDVEFLNFHIYQHIRFLVGAKVSNISMNYWMRQQKISSRVVLEKIIFFKREKLQ